MFPHPVVVNGGGVRNTSANFRVREVVIALPVLVAYIATPDHFVSMPGPGLVGKGGGASQFLAEK